MNELRIDPSLIINFDMYDDPRFAHDIHEGLAQLRKESPGIFFTPQNGGHWVITESTAIEHVMKTPATFSSRNQTIPSRPNQPHLIPVSLDPPEHLLYRRLLMTYFEHQAVNALEGRVKYWATTLVNDLREQRGCEFVAEISSRLPIYVFMELVGLPMERHLEFRDLAHRYLVLSGDPVEGEILAGQILAVLTEHIERCQKAPQQDLISKLILSEFDGRRLRLDELQSIAFLLFLAGLDTVTNAMTYGVRHLARDRALQNTLRAQPELLANAVDELMRRFAFVNSPRMVSEDTVLNGVPLQQGDLVLVMLPMLGLDPNVNPKPESVDIGRAKCKHAAFGAGGHICLGRHLAKLEMIELYRTFLENVPAFEIDPEKSHAKPRSGFAMSLPELWIRW